ncbi:MAG: hypothetical protein V8R30_00555 [Clostridia bacterium]|jgi:hypothetical protein
MFFRKKKELESTIKARTKALKEAENRVVEYRSLFKKVSEENKILRNFYEEVSYLVTSNTYRADSIILNRIKELVKEM